MVRKTCGPVRVNVNSERRRMTPVREIRKQMYIKLNNPPGVVYLEGDWHGPAGRRALGRTTQRWTDIAYRDLSELGAASNRKEEVAVHYRAG